MVKHPFSKKKECCIEKPKKQHVTIIDVGGAKCSRQKYWAPSYKHIDGLIFVIDASEKNRLDENQATLEELLQYDKMTDKPLLM